MIQHSYRETIQPIASGVVRPLWSVMIPTYNCANYLRETLISILAQDPGIEVMQIEVVDDCSTKDDPEVVVREIGGDRVSFYRQPENVGYIKNFNTCLQRARGHLVHLLHGDDDVRHGFYRKMQQSFATNPEIGAAFCRHIFINEFNHWQFFSILEQPESGILSNWLEKIAVINHIQPPSIVVRREVYEQLGGFDSRISCCGEDWEMWIRIATKYPVWYEVEPLAMYRVHSSSLTARTTKTGENIQDLRLVTKIVKSYLPHSIANKLFRQAQENGAIYAIQGKALNSLYNGNFKTAIVQVKEGIKFSYSLTVIKALFFVILKSGIFCVKNTFNKLLSPFVRV